MRALSWKQLLVRRLPLLGHRNWIGVVDSAYPWQTAPGIELVETGAGHLIVLKGVLDAIRSAPHVRPLVYLDAELSSLPTSMNHGISALRQKMSLLLDREEVTTMPHDEIIKRLDSAASRFKVLLFKTEMTLPYTSIFLELNCGYWSNDAERKLRTSLSKKS